MKLNVLKMSNKFSIVAVSTFFVAASTFFIAAISFLAAGQTAFAESGAKILKISGDVKVRRGLDETWQPAARGMGLEVIDSIIALEGEITLEIENGFTFTLGNNSMIDISDLRKITRREMFLILMSEKVEKIPQRGEKTKLRIGNVSVVHGESKAKTAANPDNAYAKNWRQELNGAKAMLNHEYFPNSIVKLHKIRNKYQKMKDFGELHFYLGEAFDRLDETGQAVDAYRIAITQSKNCDIGYLKKLRAEARKTIRELVR